MGRVVDALRGKPGDTHSLIIERNNEQIKISTKVEQLL